MCAFVFHYFILQPDLFKNLTAIFPSGAVTVTAFNIFSSLSHIYSDMILPVTYLYSLNLSSAYNFVPSFSVNI